MDATCVICKRSFTWRSKTKDGEPMNEESPRTCGKLYCEAMDTWTDEQWAGRARMAKAREASGKIVGSGPVDPDYRPSYPRQDEQTWVTTCVWVDPLNDLDREALRRVRS